MHKCTLQDSVPGTALLNLGVFLINKMPTDYRDYFE